MVARVKSLRIQAFGDSDGFSDDHCLYWTQAARLVPKNLSGLQEGHRFLEKPSGKGFIFALYRYSQNRFCI